MGRSGAGTAGRVIDGETVLDPTGDPLPRMADKRINFGIIYGCEAPRLIRWLPHAQRSDDKYVGRACRAQGLNDLCQSLGHILLEIAMQLLLDFIWKNNLDWKPCNDQHDGFLMDVPEEEVDQAASMSQHVMESIPRRELRDWLQCPLEAEIKTGDNWGAMVKCKEAA